MSSLYSSSRNGNIKLYMMSLIFLLINNLLEATKTSNAINRLIGSE